MYRAYIVKSSYKSLFDIIFDETYIYDIQNVPDKSYTKFSKIDIPLLKRNHSNI